MRRNPISPWHRTTSLPIVNRDREPEVLVEADPVALHWVELTRRQARRIAHWQFRIEMAIVGAAIGGIIVPALLGALRHWWQS